MAGTMLGGVAACLRAQNQDQEWPAPESVKLSKEILFIDTGAADAAALISGARAGVRTVVLNPQYDALAQVAEALSCGLEFDAVHIVAHGAPGRIDFSSGPVSLANLRQHDAALARIAAALAPDAELLLWACAAGSGSEGRAFVDALGVATGADIAASTQPIGAAALGGRWKLDVGSAAGARAPFTQETIASYRGVLATKLWYVTSGEDSSEAGLSDIDISGAHQQNNFVVDTTFGGGSAWIETIVDPSVGASGVYYVLEENTASGGSATLYKGTLGSNAAPTSAVTFSNAVNDNSNDADVIGGLQIDATNHHIYVGYLDYDNSTNFNMQPATTGILEMDYNSTTGAVTNTNHFLVTETSNPIPADALGYYAPVDFALGDGALFFVQQAFETSNQIYRVDLATGHAVNVVLNQTQFPADWSGGVINDVEIDTTNHLLFFSVHDENQPGTHNGVYYISDAATGSTTATQLSLPGISANFSPNNMLFDSTSRVLYVTSEETTDGLGNGAPDDVIYAFQLNAAGTAVTSLLHTFSPFTGDPTGTVSDIGGMFLVQNVAPTLTGLDPATFAENTVNAAPQIIDSNVTFADSDDTDYTGGSMAVSYSVGGGAQDNISVHNFGTGAGQIGVSGSNITYGGTTFATFTGGTSGSALNISFTTSTASPTSIDALIQALQYQNTSDTPTATRTVSIVVTDPSGASNTAATSLITVNAENDAPVVTSGGNTAYTELNAAVLANSSLTVADPDSPNLTGGTVTITNALTGDELTINGTTSGTITGINYSFAGGVLTLTGSATVANYQAALDAVKFDSTSHDPTNGNSSRTLQWQVDDGSGSNHASNTASSSIAITAVNDAPGLSVPATYTGTPGNAITINGITFSDVDSESGTEVATFSAPAGTFSAATVAGVTIGSNNSNNLTLTGTVANLNSYISGNNLTYTTTSTQTITVDINDQGHTGTPGAQHTSLTSQANVEAAPTIANLNGDTVTFTEGGAPLLLDLSPAAVVSDTDSTDFNGGNLTVAIAIGGVAGEDVLSIIAGNGITVSSGTVSYNGNVIGTAAGGTSGNPLVVTFTTTDATPAATSALIGEIAYQDTNGNNPSGTDRVVRFTVNDGDGATSSNYDVTVHVTPVNDSPVVGGAGNSVSYTEQAAAIALDTGITVSDVDNATLAGATVKISAGFQFGDTLHFTNQNGITGSYDAANHTLSLTGSSSVANYQTALASVTFDNATNDNPTDFGLYSTRTIDWQVNDGTALPTPFYSAAAPFATGSRPYSVALSDLNGDGKLDLIVANFGSDSVSVLAGNGDGTFGAATNFAAGTGPTSVVTGDFNHDGKVDLAVANANSNNLSILLGDGLGGFGAAANFAVGSAPYAVAAADLNGDGKLDLVTANSASDNISILLGDGAGGFGAATNLAVGGEPESVAIGDFNGDGKLDLAISNVVTSDVSVLLGNGNGGFGAATAFAVGTSPVSVATGDLNGDGKLDLVTANTFSGNVSVLLGDGSGGFGAATNFAAGTAAYSVAIADVNGDGIPDLVVGNNGSGDVSVLLGTGGGSFAAAVNFAAGTSIVPIAVGDLDGTGGPDIVVANEEVSGTVSVLLNQSSALSALQHTTVNLTGVNDPPTFVSGFNNTVGFTENGSAVTLSSSGVIADADSLTLAGATAQITTGLLTGDTLSVNLPTTSGVIDGTNIAWSYASGLLTLSGVDTIANYQNAIEHVQYVTASDDPTSGGDNSRVISWQLNDGAGSNNLSTTTTTTQVNITAINDEPTLTATATNPTYHENDAPATLFSAAAASTIETGQTIASMTLTVSGLADGASELLFIDGSNVALTNGNSIVTATHGLTVNVSVSGSTATASFTGATLSASAAQTLVNSLGYSDASDTPTEANRTVTLTQIVDSGSNVSPNDSTTSLSIASTVGVVAVDDAPVLTGLTDTPTFVENGASVLLDTNQNAAVSDPELNAFGNYAGSSLTIERHGGPNSDDAFAATGSLDVVDSGTGGNVSLDGGGTFIGTFVDNGDGSIKFTFNASATAADIGDVMRQIVYANSSDNPPTTVPVDFIFDDGNGETGGQPQGTGAGITTATINVQITQVDDAPALLNVAVAASYLVNTPGTDLSPGVQVFDVDATPPSTLTGMASALVEITSGFFAGDALFVNLPTSGGFFIVDDGSGPVVTNISAVADASGHLNISGVDTTQHYQDVLDAVSYHSTASDPTNGGADPTRTIEWHISDGALDNAAPSVPHYPETTLGFESNQAPTDISLTPSDVPENSPNGTVVGIFGSTDANTEDTHSYTLLDNAGGAFAISGQQLVVANSLLLDYEQHSTEQITVRSTDSGGLFVDKVMTVAVDNVDPETVGGGSGNDVIYGGSGSDVINGGGGDDVVNGNGGDDWLGGGTGNDHISGGDGNDTMWGEDGNDTISGGPGNDSIIGGAGNDVLGGDDGNDIINGGDGNDTIFGGAGDDILGGGAGDDTILGGDGNDTIWGEDGNDTINGGAGNDVIFGGAGADTLGGGSGDDQLLGGDGNDTLFGEDGNDFLIGGAGDDTMTGGAGHDAFVFSPGDGHDTITDFTTAAGPNSDYIWLAGTDLHTFADVVAHESFNVATGATTITYNGTNTITINNTTPTQLTQDHFIFS